MPDAYLWLDPSWLNLGFSLALTVCESWAIFFVSSWSVNLIRVFSVVVRKGNGRRTDRKMQKKFIRWWKSSLFICLAI